MRNRRGPATVTGDAERTRPRGPQPLARHVRAGKAREVGPEARRPPSDRKAEKPSWKGVALRCTSSCPACRPESRCSLAAPGALAAPVTVDLRIEGADADAVRRSGDTDVRTFPSPATTPHRCDGTAANGGTSATPMPTRGAALAGRRAAPFAMHGDWSDRLRQPVFNDVEGETYWRSGSTTEVPRRVQERAVAQVGRARPGRHRRRVLFAVRRRRRSAARARAARPPPGRAGPRPSRSPTPPAARRSRARRSAARPRPRTARRPSGPSRSAASRTSRRPRPARCAPTACACA